MLTPSVSRGSGFGALWSVGIGIGEAKGYGKSSLGRYVSLEVNKDFGQGILGRYLPEAEVRETPIMASFASFKKDGLTGFQAVSFRHAEWLCEPQQGTYDNPLTVRIRAL